MSSVKCTIRGCLYIIEMAGIEIILLLVQCFIPDQKMEFPYWMVLMSFFFSVKVKLLQKLPKH